jgi:hypothetical protein
MNNPLCKPPYDRPVCEIRPPDLTNAFRACAKAPRELTPAESRRLFDLCLKLDSLHKRVAFLDAKIEAMSRQIGWTWTPAHGL